MGFTRNVNRKSQKCFTVIICFIIRFSDPSYFGNPFLFAFNSDRSFGRPFPSMPYLAKKGERSFASKLWTPRKATSSSEVLILLVCCNSFVRTGVVSRTPVSPKKNIFYILSEDVFYQCAYNIIFFRSCASEIRNLPKTHATHIVFNLIFKKRSNSPKGENLINFFSQGIFKKNLKILE